MSSVAIRDKKKAHALFEAAMATIYNGGKAGGKDRVTGEKMMRVASHLGSGEAMGFLAGLEENKAISNSLHYRAHLEGYGQSSLSLAQKYNNGSGFERDPVEALAYASAALSTIPSDSGNIEFCKKLVENLTRELIDSGMSQESIDSISVTKTIDRPVVGFESIAGNVGHYGYFVNDNKAVESGNRRKVITDKSYTEVYEDRFAGMSADDLEKELVSIDEQLFRKKIDRAEDYYMIVYRDLSSNDGSGNFINRINEVDKSLKQKNKLMEDQIHIVTHLSALRPESILLDGNRLNKLSEHIKYRDQNNSFTRVGDFSPSLGANGFQSITAAFPPETMSLSDVARELEANEKAANDKKSANGLSPAPASGLGADLAESGGQIDYSMTEILKSGLMLKTIYDKGEAGAYFDKVLANATDEELKNPSQLVFGFLDNKKFDHIRSEYPDIDAEVEERIMSRLNDPAWVSGLCDEAGFTKSDWNELPDQFKYDIGVIAEHEHQFKPNDGSPSLASRLRDSKDVINDAKKKPGGITLLECAGWAASIATGGVALKVGFIACKYAAGKLSENKQFMGFIENMAKEGKSALDRMGIPTDKIANDFKEMKEKAAKGMGSKGFKFAAVLAVIAAAVVIGLPEESANFVRDVASGMNLPTDINPIGANPVAGDYNELMNAGNQVADGASGADADKLAMTGDDPTVATEAAQKGTSSNLKSMIANGPVEMSIEQGDSLWRIAERSLSGMGLETSGSNIQKAVEALHSDNLARGLVGANPDLILAGKDLYVDPAVIANAINPAAVIDTVNTVAASGASELGAGASAAAQVLAGAESASGASPIAAVSPGAGLEPTEDTIKQSLLGKLKSFMMDTDVFRGNPNVVTGAIEDTLNKSIDEALSSAAEETSGLGGTGKINPDTMSVAQESGHRNTAPDRDLDF